MCCSSCTGRSQGEKKLHDDHARRSGRGSAGRNASRRMIVTRAGSDESASSMTRAICSGSPMTRALTSSSCDRDGSASRRPSIAGSSPFAHWLTLTYPGRGLVEHLDMDDARADVGERAVEVLHQRSDDESGRRGRLQDQLGAPVEPGERRLSPCIPLVVDRELPPRVLSVLTEHEFEPLVHTLARASR